MKTLLCTCLSIIFFTTLLAQECGDQRYYEEIFDYNCTTDILFGEAPQPLPHHPDNTQQLFMDIYQPEGDTLSARPLIIWAFGGGFVLGSKESPDIVTLSKSFAKRGYVNAAIDYRLSRNLVAGADISSYYEAVIKASHDMQASIRFFYKDAATTNQYKVDLSRIYIAGVSAGAITAIHTAHFDELEEVPMEVQAYLEENGGFTGKSGNEGFPQDVAGVINLCGAIGDTAWINPAKPLPIVSMHGTEDDIVPYGTDTVEVFGIDEILDGSATIHQKLDKDGVKNDFYTFQGAGHTPFVRDQAYMDTTIWFVRDFLYDLHCGTSADSAIDGTKDDTTADHSNVGNTTNISFSVYPNPNRGTFYISLESVGDLDIVVLDYFGNSVFRNQELSQGLNTLELNLPPGMYTVHVYSEELQQMLNKKVIVR